MTKNAKVDKHARALNSLRFWNKVAPSKHRTHVRAGEISAQFFYKKHRLYFRSSVPIESVELNRVPANWVILHKCKLCKVKAAIATKDTSEYNIGEPVIIRIFRNGTLYHIKPEEIAYREMGAIRHAVWIWLKSVMTHGS